MWHRRAPNFLESQAAFIERNHPGQVVRFAAHVRSALDIVLSAQRIHASTRLSEIAGEQRKIHEAHHAISAVSLLGQAEAMKRHRRFCCRVESRSLADGLWIDIANARRFLRRKRADEFAKFIPAGD